MSDKNYDVVVVGGGIAGAIVAKELAVAKKSVLVLEAGTATGSTPEGYRTFLQNFYQSLTYSAPNAPYPANSNAPAQSLLDIVKISPGKPDTSGYYVQNGPLPFGSNNTRTVGGTTLHWLGTALRMLPSDFQMQSRYGVSQDWPFGYDKLMPYYRLAERELGVAADVEEQSYLGLEFAPGYVFPMHKIPSTWLDVKIAESIDGMPIRVGKRDYPVKVVNIPVARNSTPNADYDGGKGYTPVGAVGDPNSGQRCEGSTSCIPICPVQAKYNAMKTLYGADAEVVEIRTQAVASRVEVDPRSGRVTGILYKEYASPGSSEFTSRTARGKLYVIAAHAIETAKLLLASGVANSSDQLGRNLMDHPYINTLGLMREDIGSFRGPLISSGVPSLRDGEFRGAQAAFRVDIANNGWTFPRDAPRSTVNTMVNEHNLFGAQLRKQLRESVSRQFRFGFLVEQLPDPRNRVAIDPQYVDAIGNYRPVLSYEVSSYTRAGFAQGKMMSDQLFQRLGAEDHTAYNVSDPGYLTYDGKGYTFSGAGHAVGTHRIGTSASNSVVNVDQKTWDHENMYLVGCGNMPTIGTSNPTLTMAALTFWAAENIKKDLDS